MEKKVIGSEIVKPTGSKPAQPVNQNPNRKVKPTLNTDPYKDKMAQERAAVLELTKQFGIASIDGDASNAPPTGGNAPAPNAPVNGAKDTPAGAPDKPAPNGSAPAGKQPSNEAPPGKFSTL